MRAMKVSCNSILHRMLLGAILVLCLPLALIAEDQKDAVDLKAMSLQQLFNLWNNSREPGLSIDSDGRVPFCQEAVLAEIVRRGGPDAESVIATELSKAPFGDFVLLTALRRVQRRCDPLTPVVKDVKPMLPASGKRSSLEIAFGFKNTDTGKSRIYIYLGSRRHWRFEVRNEKGQLMPMRRDPPRGGTGLVLGAILEFGESWTGEQQPLSAYIDSLEAGKYTVTALYNDTFPIADVTDESDLAKLIVLRSEPFEFTVKSEP